MPTRLKCTACGERFYTARGSYYMPEGRECEYCAGRLEIYEEAGRVLSTGLSVRLIADANYRGRITSVSDEEVEIALPEAEGVPASFAPGSECGVQFFRREPGLQARYSFTSRVVGAADSSWQKDPKLVLAAPEDVWRSQQRRSRRIAVRFPVQYRVLRAEENGDVEASATFRSASVVNISRSGALLAVDETEALDLRENEELQLLFHLNGFGLETRARVIRRCEFTERGEKKLSLGVEFSANAPDWEQILC